MEIKLLYIIIAIQAFVIAYLYFDCSDWKKLYYDMWFKVLDKLENVGIDATNDELRKEVGELRNRLGEWVD